MAKKRRGKRTQKDRMWARLRAAVKQSVRKRRRNTREEDIEDDWAGKAIRDEIAEYSMKRFGRADPRLKKLAKEMLIIDAGGGGPGSEEPSARWAVGMGYNLLAKAKKARYDDDVIRALKQWVMGLVEWVAYAKRRDELFWSKHGDKGLTGGELRDLEEARRARGNPQRKRKSARKRRGKRTQKDRMWARLRAAVKQSVRKRRRNRASSADLAKAAGLWKRRRKGRKSRRNPRKPRLGSGGRFKQLVSKLKRRGARSPGALAAWIGREKWGKARFQKMSAAGRKRASRKNG